MNDPSLDLVARLWKLGRTPEEIARRTNKPLGWVNQVINDTEMRERAAALPATVVDEGEEIWNADTKKFHREVAVPDCFKLWIDLVRDPDAPAAARLRASENLMKYDTDLVDNTKVDDEKTTHLHMSDAIAERLLRLEKEARGWD